VDDSRHNIALYADLEHKLTSELLLGAAVRWEKYSDFGSTTTGKLSLRYDPSKTVGLRGSVSTGFRAPSVQQKFYSSVSTNLNAAGVLTETLTAREGSAVTKAFGIANLKEETSKNASVGMVLRPASNFSLTADLWGINIDDRIVFSSNIAPEAGACATAAACPIKAILDPLKVGQAQFFTNAIDTDHARPRHRRRAHHALVGFDAGAVRPARLQPHQGDAGRHSSSPVLSGAQLFDDAQVTLIERGQPRQHHVLAADYTTGAWNGNARANYYGEVQGQGFTAPFVQTWDAKWIAGRHAALQLHQATSLTVGSNNIFNTFPTKWDPVKAAPFPQLGFTYCWETCPFGINGRSWYARVDVMLNRTFQRQPGWSMSRLALEASRSRFHIHSFYRPHENPSPAAFVFSGAPMSLTLYDTYERRLRPFESLEPRPRRPVRLRPDRLRLRPHRQPAHLSVRRHAAPRAAAERHRRCGTSSTSPTSAT
jgi:iron complex outermembrane receptor protein